MNTPSIIRIVSEATAANEIRIPGWKRVLDIALTILALPLLLPLAAFITVGISLVSPGPILFRQERVGFLGRRFLCLKFRTMVVGADTKVHQGHLKELLTSDVPMVKMDAKGDPRVIPFGGLLRASGLDELPQIWNVLVGDMSLVGPRPCVPYEYAQYLPWQMERFNALPGLTGLWQVSGKNRTTFVEMINLDINYTRNQNPWLDLRIIFKTIPALILQALENRRRKKSAAELSLPEPTVLSRPTNGYPVSESARLGSAHSFQRSYLTRKS